MADKVKYRLKPEIIAAFSGELLPVWVGADYINFDIAGRIHTFPDDLVEPVEPPMPDEPGPGIYAIGPKVVQRLNDGDADPYRWMVVGDGDEWRWGTVWENWGGPGVRVRRLIPEPGPCQECVQPGGAEAPNDGPLPMPVALPWHLTSVNGWGRGEVRLAVEDNPTLPIAYSIDDNQRWLSIVEARSMAAALLTAAARAAVGQQPGGAS